MRRAIWILSAVFVVAVLVVPAFAGWRVLTDTFDRGAGVGVAVVQLDRLHYAEIRYRDMDDTQSFTLRDIRLETRYFYRDEPAIGPVLKRLG